jgi:hypothetical protein
MARFLQSAAGFGDDLLSLGNGCGGDKYERKIVFLDGADREGIDSFRGWAREMEPIEHVSRESLGCILVPDKERDFVAAVGVVEMHIALAVEQANPSANQMVSGGYDSLGDGGIAHDALRERLHISIFSPPLSRRFGYDLFLMIIRRIDTNGSALDPSFCISDGGDDDKNESNSSSDSISP